MAKAAAMRNLPSMAKLKMSQTREPRSTVQRITATVALDTPPSRKVQL